MTNTQPYILGQQVYCEAMTETKWNVYMVDIDGFPVMRDLTEEAAKFIVEVVNNHKNGLNT